MVLARNDRTRQLVIVQLTWLRNWQFISNRVSLGRL
jgi:hypothetical protein